MIKNLSGDYETVEYDSSKYILLHDNTDNEAYPVHWHDAIELIMPLENAYIVTADGTEYNIPENDVLVIPPAVLHSMPAVRGRRLILQCDNSELGDVAALDPVMRGLISPVLINADYNKDLHLLARKTMNDIAELYGSGSELADVRMYIELVELLTALRATQLEKQKMKMQFEDIELGDYSSKFAAVLKYIDSNYMNDITLDELADVAGYSKYHFSRIFKQYSSMSYLRYINARRTRAAEQLLLDPALPITEVAMRSGFRSLTTFNRIFKEIKHCTPTDFKKLYSLR